MGNKITKVMLALAGYAIAALFSLITLGFLVAALYLVLASVLAPAGAAAATGGAMFLLAMSVIFVVRSMGWRSTRRTEKASTRTAEQLGEKLRTAGTLWLSDRARYTVPTALVSGFIVGASPKARRSLVRILRDVIAAVQSPEEVSCKTRLGV